MMQLSLWDDCSNMYFRQMLLDQQKVRDAQAKERERIIAELRKLNDKLKHPIDFFAGNAR